MPALSQGDDAAAGNSGAHCRIEVSDGSTGSGTLIAADEAVGLVLTCSHLFDQTEQRIIVCFSNGTRFEARLIDRDRAHDLAALAIRKPAVQPLPLGDEPASGELRACGFGPHGQFRCIVGNVTGHATAVGATYPSLTLMGSVRPGDSGGGVLNRRGEVVGVVWGQRAGLTYTTCGKPVRDFLGGLRGRRFVPQGFPGDPPPAGRDPDMVEWTREIEKKLEALDVKKQDKGNYLKAEALDEYLRVADAPKLDTAQFAARVELEGQAKSNAAQFEAVHSAVESIREHIRQVAASKHGLLQGLSFGKLVVGALGLSGPVAAAVVVAGGLASRRINRRMRSDRASQVSHSRAEVAASDIEPIAVDSPPPPQRAVPETHFVSVEKDTFAKAHQWASEHVARKYPGATEILQSQDSLIKQYLAASRYVVKNTG